MAILNNEQFQVITDELDSALQDVENGKVILTLTLCSNEVAKVSIDKTIKSIVKGV